VGLAARQPDASNFLYQERAIFDHLFDVAVQGAELLRPRLLLINALENQARRRPEVVREYLGKLSLLQQQHPTPDGSGKDLILRGVRTVGEKANA
jgi:hypothetical protein